MISNARGGITVAASSGLPASFRYLVKASSKGISTPAEMPAKKALYVYFQEILFREKTIQAQTAMIKPRLTPWRIRFGGSSRPRFALT